MININLKFRIWRSLFQINHISLPALTEYLVGAEDSEYNLFGIIDRLAVDVESKSYT